MMWLLAALVLWCVAPVLSLAAVDIHVHVDLGRDDLSISPSVKADVLRAVGEQLDKALATDGSGMVANQVEHDGMRVEVRVTDSQQTSSSQSDNEQDRVDLLKCSLPSLSGTSFVWSSKRDPTSSGPPAARGETSVQLGDGAGPWFDLSHTLQAADDMRRSFYGHGQLVHHESDASTLDYDTVRPCPEDDADGCLFTQQNFQLRFPSGSVLYISTAASANRPPLPHDEPLKQANTQMMPELPAPAPVPAPAAAPARRLSRREDPHPLADNSESKAHNFNFGGGGGADMPDGTQLNFGGGGGLTTVVDESQQPGAMGWHKRSSNRFSSFKFGGGGGAVLPDGTVLNFGGGGGLHVGNARLSRFSAIIEDVERALSASIDWSKMKVDYAALASGDEASGTGDFNFGGGGGAEIPDGTVLNFGGGGGLSTNAETQTVEGQQQQQQQQEATMAEQLSSEPEGGCSKVHVILPMKGVCAQMCLTDSVLGYMHLPSKTGVSFGSCADVDYSHRVATLTGDLKPAIPTLKITLFEQTGEDRRNEQERMQYARQYAHGGEYNRNGNGNGYYGGNGASENYNGRVEGPLQRASGDFANRIRAASNGLDVLAAWDGFLKQADQITQLSIAPTDSSHCVDLCAIAGQECVWGCMDPLVRDLTHHILVESKCTDLSFPRKRVDVTHVGPLSGLFHPVAMAVYQKEEDDSSSSQDEQQWSAYKQSVERFMEDGQSAPSWEAFQKPLQTFMLEASRAWPPSEALDSYADPKQCIVVHRIMGSECLETCLPESLIVLFERGTCKDAGYDQLQVVDALMTTYKGTAYTQKFFIYTKEKQQHQEHPLYSRALKSSSSDKADSHFVIPPKKVADELKRVNEINDTKTPSFSNDSGEFPSFEHYDPVHPSHKADTDADTHKKGKKSKAKEDDKDEKDKKTKQPSYGWEKFLPKGYAKAAKRSYAPTTPSPQQQQQQLAATRTGTHTHSQPQPGSNPMKSPDWIKFVPQAYRKRAEDTFKLEKKEEASRTSQGQHSQQQDQTKAKEAAAKEAPLPPPPPPPPCPQCPQCPPPPPCQCHCTCPECPHPQPHAHAHAHEPEQPKTEAPTTHKKAEAAAAAAKPTSKPRKKKEGEGEGEKEPEKEAGKVPLPPAPLPLVPEHVPIPPPAAPSPPPPPPPPPPPAAASHHKKSHATTTTTTTTTTTKAPGPSFDDEFVKEEAEFSSSHNGDNGKGSDKAHHPSVVLVEDSGKKHGDYKKFQKRNIPIKGVPGWQKFVPPNYRKAAKATRHADGWPPESETLVRAEDRDAFGTTESFDWKKYMGGGSGGMGPAASGGGEMGGQQQGRSFYDWSKYAADPRATKASVQPTSLLGVSGGDWQHFVPSQTPSGGKMSKMDETTSPAANVQRQGGQYFDWQSFTDWMDTNSSGWQGAFVNNNEMYCKFVTCPKDRPHCVFGNCRAQPLTPDDAVNFKCRWVSCPPDAVCVDGNCVNATQVNRTEAEGQQADMGTPTPTHTHTRGCSSAARLGSSKFDWQGFLGGKGGSAPDIDWKKLQEEDHKAATASAKAADEPPVPTPEEISAALRSAIYRAEKTADGHKRRDASDPMDFVRKSAPSGARDVGPDKYEIRPL